MEIKIQDVGFLIGLLFLLVLARSRRWFFIAGLGSLVLSFFVFQLGILFTGERLTWYGAAFILVGLFWKEKE